MVPIKQSQKARLRPRRPLYAPKPYILSRPLQIPQIHQQLLDPQRRALADGRELRGLEVGEAECGEVAILSGEGGEAVDDDGELLDEEGECGAEEDEVGVAGEAVSMGG
jgi:hypothetical protein